MHRATQAYRQTTVTTTNQGEVVVMLYAGAIRFLTQAKEQIILKNYAEKGTLISKALDIVHELDSTLNPEKGGEIAQNLHNLYFICSSKMLQANLRLDITLIDEVIAVLDGLRSAFATILNTPEAKAAVEEASINRTASAQHMRTPTPMQQPPQPMPGTSTARARNVYMQQKE